MTRRLFTTGLSGLAAGLAVACSPLGVMNALSPRDGAARRVARDLPYGDQPRQTMDLYAPAGAGPWPVVVFFYGGGWDSGAKGLYGWAAQALAAQGFLVALPDYRIVPQVHFPTFVEDAAAAVAHVARIAADHGGDPARLAVSGHSAGAHQALMITLDRRYMARAGAPDVIRAAAGLSGPYEFLPFDVPASINAFGQWPDPAETQPITYARGDAPPVWLAHGERDVTVHAEDSVLLAEAIRRAGGQAELKLYPDLDHASTLAAFSPVFRRRAPVLADLTRFLGNTLT